MIKINEVVEKLFELQKVQVREGVSKSIYYAFEQSKALEGHALQSKFHWDFFKELGSFAYQSTIYRVFCRVFVADGIDYDGKPYSNYTSGNQHHTPLKIKENWKEILEKMIDNDMEEIMGSFLKKMEHKLLDVIKTKQIIDFNTQGWIQGHVSLKFDDGSHFLLSNSIEYGCSKFGKHFQKYPTRYHNVFLKGEVGLKQPSEKKMKEEF